MNIEVVLNLIIIVLILLTWYLHKNYIPKYFEEKGKNLATKEDIEDITKIVEGVKYELLKDTEVFKAQLLISNQTKFSFENVYREAIYDYNKNYSSWLKSIASFSFVEFNELNYQDSSRYLEVISSREYEFDLSLAHLKLFLNDDEFNKISRNLEIETLILKKILQEAITQFNYNFQKYNIVSETNKSTVLIDTHKERVRIVEEFLDKKVKQYDKIYKEYLLVLNFIRQKLLKLSEN